MVVVREIYQKMLQNMLHFRVSYWYVDIYIPTQFPIFWNFRVNLLILLIKKMEPCYCFINQVFCEINNIDIINLFRLEIDVIFWLAGMYGYFCLKKARQHDNW